MKTFSERIRAAGRTRPLVVALAAAVLVIAVCGASATSALAAGPVTGLNCSPSCDLYAATGTMPASSLPGAPAGGVAVWGYNTTGAAPTAPGGPVIVVNQNDAVQITLHNANIPTATSLVVAGQPGVPDATGITSGNTKTYTFAAGTLKPGTYLYEAGLTPDGPRQVAMGLFGALIVRPTGAPLQAYGANTTFNDEAVLVLSEIDPAFNAAWSTFDLNSRSPRYWLINGKVYPNTDTITAAAAGNKVLLRYVNAGLTHHSMAVLGLHQTVIATDGLPIANQEPVVAETVPTGGTLDTIATMPATPPANARYAVFDAAMHQDNAGVLSTPANPNPAYTPIAFGGMLTFVQVGGTSTPPGPVTSAVTLAPNPTNGSVAVTLAASVQSATSTVSAAEYFIDTVGANGAGTAMTGAFGGATASVNATVSVAQLATLASGNHTFYVHGRDANGWGAVATAVLNLDKAGPAISNMSVTPSITNGSVDVALQSTASDVNTGNQNVVAGEYNIDGGSATAFSFTPATTVSLSASIPAATIAGLAQGSHQINVRGQDALGNWGAYGSITLKVDKAGPTTTGVSTTPNPTNGTFGVQVSTGGGYYQRIDATVTDQVNAGVNSNVVAAEYFIDTIGANGTGGTMFATSGAYNGTSVTVYGAADLFAIAALSQGNHTIYVHGKDAAGNWGNLTSTTLTVDKTSPAISALSTTPNPANLAATVTLNITAADPVNNGTPANGPASNLTGGEFFWGTTDPGVGSGTAFSFASPAPSGTFGVSIDVSQRTIFTNNTLSVRVKDAAGNWSTVSTTAISVDRIFANSFPTSAQPYGWSATGGNAARLSLNSGANMKDAGTNSLVANVATGASGYVVNNIPTAQTSYRARFYVNPNGATLTAGVTPTIFAALNGTSTVFQVQMRRSGGNYQVRVLGNTSNNTWFTITGATAVEVARSGSSLTLYTAGVSRQTVSVATTGINVARLGLSAGVTSGMNGSNIYFDGFVSSRTVTIGP